MLPEDVQRPVPQSTRVCVFTGAGVSAESGIPTFRGTDGLWEDHPVEDLETFVSFGDTVRSVHGNILSIWRSSV